MNTPENITIDELYFSRFHTSQKAMAASIQSLTCCRQVIKEAKLQTILDCGSGLSSVVFHSEFEQVVTVDDDAGWAAKTSQLIQEFLGKDIEISTLDNINNPFDFVFYDYGGIETRIFHFKKALQLCTRLMYIDDLHITYYREYVETKTRNYKLIYLPQSLDEFGRYGAILRKN
jgi:hypothetical protein